MDPTWRWFACPCCCYYLWWLHWRPCCWSPRCYPRTSDGIVVHYLTLSSCQSIFTTRNSSGVSTHMYMLYRNVESHRMYTFYGQTCRMYTFYWWIVECIHSTVGAIECVYSMACVHGMHTFYTLFHRMYAFYTSTCRLCTFYDIFNNLT